jgi:hypothetical protein
MEYTIKKAFASNDVELHEWVQRIFPGMEVLGTREENLRMVVMDIIDRSRLGLTGEIA